MNVAEKQLDALIGKRARMEEQSREEEMAWKASVRRYNSERHEASRAAWEEFYSRLADTHERLCEENRRKAAGLRLPADRGEGVR